MERANNLQDFFFILYFAGGVVDLNHSPVPTPNGYQHRISPCSSPGVVPCAKPMHRGSPVPLPTSPVPQGAVVSSSQQLRPNPSLRIVPPAMRSDHASEVIITSIILIFKIYLIVKFFKSAVRFRCFTMTGM